MSFDCKARLSHQPLTDWLLLLTHCPKITQTDTEDVMIT